MFRYIFISIRKRLKSQKHPATLKREKTFNTFLSAHVDMQNYFLTFVQIQLKLRCFNYPVRIWQRKRL